MGLPSGVLYTRTRRLPCPASSLRAPLFEPSAGLPPHLLPHLLRHPLRLQDHRPFRRLPWLPLCQLGGRQ